MRSALALIRANFLTAASYRLAWVMSIVGLGFQIVPTYYVGKTLDPYLGAAIKGEGSDYFGFLVMGTVVYLLLAAAVDSLPRALERGINTGTLELIFSTPSSVPSLLVGLTGYELLWATARCFIVLGAAAAFGFHAHWERFGEAAVILAMIVATYFGAGMVAGGMIIAYRRTGQLQTAVIVGSAMIGGVLYPTKLVPHWAARFSDVVPMTYGIRAVRRITIDDWPLRAVLPDVGMLAIFCVAFLAVGSLAMTHALRRARAEGTLSQY
ncbi:MAG TPA: ABC transporter permease [Gemmatimonadaceae bacterium]|nr:ABC transporter permease [Gemmatimonadaceae bacterium]